MLRWRSATDNPEKLENKILHWELKQQKKIIREGSVVIPDGAFDLVELDEITFDFPEITEAADLSFGS